MFGTFESGIGLDIVVWLQNHGNQTLDYLATALHFGGSPIMLLFTVPIIYWKVDRTLAWQFLLALLLSMLSVSVFKHLFHAPRPHLAYPTEVHSLVSQNGYGFPSGHVMTAVLLSVLIGRRIKHQGMWFIGIAYVMMIGWARMYAGVHYPHDVLGGLVIGIVLALTYHSLLKKLETTNSTTSPPSSPTNHPIELDRI